MPPKRDPEFIKHASKRKAAFKKRKPSIFKKMEELTTLCGIQGCAIIYSPYQQEPEVWPPGQEDFHRVLQEYQAMDEPLRKRKALTQDVLDQGKMWKKQKQLVYHVERNRKSEVWEAISHMLQYGPDMLSDMNLLDCQDIIWTIRIHKKEISEALRKFFPLNDGAVANQPHMAPDAENVSGPMMPPAAGTVSEQGNQGNVGGNNNAQVA